MRKAYEIPSVVTNFFSAIGDVRTVDYLTGAIPYSVELQCFWMAIQGCVKVREGANKDRQMNVFHSFCLSVLVGYGGGLLTPLWLGRPSGMIMNDLCFGTCILAYLIVNCMPFDVGFKLCRTFPIVIITTLFAELFRVVGLVNYCNAAFDLLKDKPSAYYPIPVFGPIFFAAMLGNMGPLFVNGFHPYLANGMPWGFQKGLFCSAFYHFYAHDTTGVIGAQLRSLVKHCFFMSTEQHGMDDNVFPYVLVSAFMHITAILQLQQFLGPSFSPFAMMSLPKLTSSRTTPATVKQIPVQAATNKQTPALKVAEQVKEATSSNGELNADGKKKKRKKKGGSKKED